MKPLISMTQLILPLVLLMPPLAHAGEYLGYVLGQDTFEGVIKKLEQHQANFHPGYSYRGDNRLKLIKVNADASLQQRGDLKVAWLSFRPDGVLYALTVSWYDAGVLHTTLKDALDLKYAFERQAGRGFETSRYYRDKTTRIELYRNTFGFGRDQVTTLEYTDTTALPAVEAMQRQIDRDIKQRHRDKAGADL